MPLPPLLQALHELGPEAIARLREEAVWGIYPLETPHTMPGNFKKVRTNTTEVTREYSQQEIEDLLLADLANRAKLPHTVMTVDVVLKNANRTGTGPAIYEAAVRITIDHDAVQEAGSYYRPAGTGFTIPV